VKLCDFGSCKEGPILLRNANERAEAEESILKETTQMYRAPEMVNLYMRDSLTEKTDVWAMGCVLFSLCFLKHPFQDQSSLAIIAGKYQFPKDSPYPIEINELISRMLDVSLSYTMCKCLD
jgi:serine/threonine protein kinase